MLSALLPVGKRESGAVGTRRQRRPRTASPTLPRGALCDKTAFSCRSGRRLISLVKDPSCALRIGYAPKAGFLSCTSSGVLTAAPSVSAHTPAEDAMGRNPEPHGCPCGHGRHGASRRARTGSGTGAESWRTHTGHRGRETHTKATCTSRAEKDPPYLGVGKEQSCHLVRHHGCVPRDVPGQDRHLQVHRLQDGKETLVGSVSGK